MRKCNKEVDTLKSFRKDLSEEVTIWTDNLKDEKESIRWVISEVKHFLGNGMSRCKASEVGKGLMSFLRNWKEAKWLKGCELAWDEAGAAGRGLPATYERLWRVLSRQDRHRIRPPWLLLENGLEGASQETIWVVLVTYGQWLWWWEKSGYIWDASWR